MHISEALFNASNQAICLLFILLIPLAGAGLALISTGLNRSHSAAHAMLSSIVIGTVAMLTYFVIGFAFEGIAGQPAHAFSIAGKNWDWLGAGSLFFAAVGLDGRPASLAVIFGLFTVPIASMIPAASLGERWRLGASCASTTLFAAWTYPLFAHWVWGGGWLAQMGAQFGLADFMDSGGSGCIHATGGLTALALAWIIGPRRGRFTADGIPTAMPGHNAVVVLFGCVLAFIGFLGLNSAGAILFATRTPAQTVLVGVNTALAAAAAALTALATTRIRFGRPDASLTANGWVAGLVAISAGCAFVKPAEAVLIGMVAGALVIFAIELLELRMKIDDPTGAIAVHAGGGIWGVLAVGIFARVSNVEASSQFLAQLLGIASLLGLILPLTY
ncbi:MAG: ammonium transporter, partial [Acidobacteriaceae bacterium]|nr:ammonium transporter [Acidobacteriaceae bacterium]